MKKTKDKDPRPVVELLNDNQRFRFIIQRAKHLISLQKLIDELLPKELKPHCHVANINGSQLILTASSGAQATHLNYLAPELLQRLQFYDQWRHIQSIRAKVFASPEKAP